MSIPSCRKWDFVNALQAEFNVDISIDISREGKVNGGESFPLQEAEL